MAGTPIGRDLEENLSFLRERLGIGVTFDVLLREVEVGGKRGALLFVDGFVKDKVTVDLIESLQKARREEIVPMTIRKLLARIVPYFEVDEVQTLEEVVDQVLAGPLALLVEGERSAIIIDVREYPVRGIEEPDLERVTRGSHEGFVETMIFNTALIRRRLRDPNLRFEVTHVGTRSRTDVAIGYIDGIADPRLVSHIKERIAKASLDAMPMGVKNLEEVLLESPWNPIPRVRYTERPDVAAAHLLEGHIVIIVDTTPMAAIVPVTLFHFLEHAEEYFQSPVIGSYLRFIRTAAFGIAAFLTPAWLALYLMRDALPQGLTFIGPKDAGTAVPVPIQFLMLEFGIDLIRMALIHTPSALATSLGIVGAILLGDLAVEVGLFIPETILYTAVTAIAYFAIPSIELGYAIRLYRYLLILLVILFQGIGLFIGALFGFAVLAATRSLQRPYLWPLLPFDRAGLMKTLLRLPVPSVSRRPAVISGRRADLSRSGEEGAND